MKIEEVPQDLKYYKDSLIRDVNYAVDADGKYRVVISDGWEAKNDALDAAWDEVREQCEEILGRIRRGETSLLEYYAAKNLMDLQLLSSYTGFPKRKIRKHLKPEVFEQLDNDTLSVYADALRITVEELTSMPI
ncbi:MAG: hypothetical protein K6A98_02860 [Prevotella sp.]|jgi:hypothetical protein|nr:hypothetical protein [Prevotella sp.]MCR5152079.1 hypothetical protein [Prevotella sp.]